MIGLIRAEDAAGAVVAVNGHWFDVFDVHPDPDHGLVQLHGVSSTGGEQWVHVAAGAVLQWLLDLPVIERGVSCAHPPGNPQVAGTGRA